MMMHYILPMARNLRTGQTVKQQDLKGVRYGQHQRQQCQMMADRVAEQMTERTGDSWQGYCQPYTPTERR
jgi:hypothetical protein